MELELWQGAAALVMLATTLLVYLIAYYHGRASGHTATQDDRNSVLIVERADREQQIAALRAELEAQRSRQASAQRIESSKTRQLLRDADARIEAAEAASLTEQDAQRLRAMAGAMRLAAAFAAPIQGTEPRVRELNKLAAEAAALADRAPRAREAA